MGGVIGGGEFKLYFNYCSAKVLLSIFSQFVVIVIVKIARRDEACSRLNFSKLRDGGTCRDAKVAR